MRARPDNSEIRTPTPPRDARILFEIAALLRMVFSYRSWRSACGNRFPWRAEIKIPEILQFSTLLTDRSVGKFRRSSKSCEGSLSEPLSNLAPPRQSGLSAPNSREKILEIGESLFASGGYSGVGMRQIATAVGLGKSSLFHHFPTKLALYGEVLDRVLERLERGLCDDAQHPGKTAEQLGHWIDSMIGMLAEDVSAARLMLRALVDEEPFPPFEFEPEGRELMSFEIRLERVIGRFRSLLEQGIADGVFRPVSIGDTIQTTIGAIVFHFASADLGEALIGEPVFSGTAVERRRREVSEFIRRGLLA